MIVLAELTKNSWCFKQEFQGTKHNIPLGYEHWQKWKGNFSSLLCSLGLNINKSSPLQLQTVVMRCLSHQNQVHCGHAPLCLEKGYRMNRLHLLLLSLCQGSFPLPEELSAPQSSVVCVFCHSALLMHLVVSLWYESYCISAMPQSPI